MTSPATVVEVYSGGPQGPAGPSGAAGATGAAGAQGIQGLTGATGAQGPGGTVGPPGAAGAQGSTGPTGATGAPGPQGASLNPRGAWAAFTAYNLLDVVTNGGSSYTPLTAFTSGAAFNPANWLLLAAAGTNGTNGTNGATGATGPAGPAGGSEISVVTSSTTNSAAFGTSMADVAAPNGLSGLVVPNGTPPYLVEVVGDLLCSITTGTAGASSELRVQAQLVDDLGVTVAFANQSVLVYTAVALSARVNLPLRALLPAAPAQRTYRLQGMFTAPTGTQGSASCVAFFSVGAKSMRAVLR